MKLKQSMIKTLIVDDEQRFRLALRNMLGLFPDILIVAEAEGVQSAIDALSVNDIKLIFLDVEMGDGTAFDLLNNLPFNQYKIIFTTGFSDYAVKAFKYSAIDYLLKPVDVDELKNAIEKVKSVNYFDEMSKKLDTLRANRHEFSKIALAGTSGFELVDIQSIIRCESESNYTHFYLNDGRDILVARVLKDYEEILTEHYFFRVHKSHLINMRLVTTYIDGEGGFALMVDRSEIPVSRRRKKEFLQALKKD